MNEIKNINAAMWLVLFAAVLAVCVVGQQQQQEVSCVACSGVAVCLGSEGSVQVFGGKTGRLLSNSSVVSLHGTGVLTRDSSDSECGLLYAVDATTSTALLLALTASHDAVTQLASAALSNNNNNTVVVSAAALHTSLFAALGTSLSRLHVTTSHQLLVVGSVRAPFVVTAVTASSLSDVLVWTTPVTSAASLACWRWQSDDTLLPLSVFSSLPPAVTAPLALSAPLSFAVFSTRHLWLLDASSGNSSAVLQLPSDFVPQQPSVASRTGVCVCGNASLFCATLSLSSSLYVAALGAQCYALAIDPLADTVFIGGDSAITIYSLPWDGVVLYSSIALSAIALITIVASIVVMRKN